MVHVRVLEPADLDAVVGLSLRAWAPVFASMGSVLGPRLDAMVNPQWESAQAAAVRAVCEERSPHVYVAELDGTAAGFAAVALHDDDAPEPGSGEIEMIAVDPAYQRRGVARALIAACTEAMERAGCRFAVVATGGDPGHAPARAAYDAAGFTGLPLVRNYRALGPDPAG
ncbi:GNAT family N-acetyltransferase [Mumia sp. Pv 4-285]|uniref:GNAT family N-acetyltransferase n=1 Tax=Mumia qirimensis TaxID=3234852 RepID=UPI00351CC51C